MCVCVCHLMSTSIEPIILKKKRGRKKEEIRFNGEIRNPFQRTGGMIEGCVNNTHPIWVKSFFFKGDHSTKTSSLV